MQLAKRVLAKSSFAYPTTNKVKKAVRAKVTEPAVKGVQSSLLVRTATVQHLVLTFARLPASCSEDSGVVLKTTESA